MEHKTIVVANWKMKLDNKESATLAKQLKKLIKKTNKDIEIGICPSYPYLYTVAANIAGTKIKLGAQDMFWEEEGAYTGEVSPKMLKELGCKMVILGHSERRQTLAETDLMVHRKVRMALNYKLVPIVCVGESFDERNDNQTDYVIIRQVTKALEGIDLKDDDQVVIAYEPVWVIGTGQAITPDEAEHVHNLINHILLDLFDENQIKNNIRIIYGGSVTSSNVKSFTHKSMIHGVLVGGASLKADEFVEIIKNI